MQGRAVKCMKVVSWALVWAQHFRMVLLRELWGANSRHQLFKCCVFRTCTIRDVTDTSSFGQLMETMVPQ